MTQGGVILDDLLRSLEIGGVSLIKETYSAPWAVAVPCSDRLGVFLRRKEGARVLAFHYVECGRCEIRLRGGKRHFLQTAEMAVCFGGIEHSLGLGEMVRAEPLENLLLAGPRLKSTGANLGDSSLLCGAFILEDPTLNPLLRALPEFTVVSARAVEAQRLRQVLALLNAEIAEVGGGLVAEKLTEILCVEVIRRYLEAEPTKSVGWFSGLQDSIIGRSLELMHERPEKAWTVRAISKSVSLSPSRFAARFVEKMGCSPIAYLTQLRMHLATRVLASSDESIERIGYKVGYESAPAFSRAFKKYTGVSPAQWRTSRLAR